MKLRPYALLCVSALALCSCGSQTRTIGQSTIEFVRSILGDSESAEYKILKSYDPEECDAAIYVIGDVLSSSVSASELLSCDDRDNIDGFEGSDGLPDFAGERVAVVTDVSSGLYDSLVLAGKGTQLRELAVRNVLQAVDTLCFKSPFDMEGMGRKSRSKLIVLASPAMAAYGMFDVDSLLAASSCSLPVVSPVRIMAEELVSEGCHTVGVITSELRTEAGIFDKVFEDAAATAGVSVNCVSASIADPRRALTEFLDSYIESGHLDPVEVIVMDNPDCDATVMSRELVRIQSVMNEEYLKYAEYLAPDVRFVKADTILRSECYRILRERNIFTHNVSYPSREDYLVISRNPEEGMQSNILIEYNERYLPQ
ncbi:MAG: hypothetical protein MJY50_04955 [Bacteroidales bacterium]|nr:hypothetical protein [Bacteroidales bacterium]